MSDEFARILGRRKGWINNGIILTEESPEIKNFRAVLEAQGKTLPDITSLCIHLRKRRTISGAIEITFTKQGTLTEYWAQSEVTKLLEKFLVIDGVRVKAGDPHENDHVTYTNAGSMSDLRNTNPGYDRSPVVNMTKRAHRIRTNHSRRKPISFPLNKLTAPFSELFEEARRADQDFWMMEENRNVIFDDDLTPAFVAKQYSLGHLYDQVRMECNLKRKKFHPNQATAFLVNEKVKEAMDSAEDLFFSYRIPVPVLDVESKKVFSEFDQHGREEVYQNYAKKLRLFNLVDFSIHRGRCVTLLHTLELYSESPAGGEDGCTAFQTEYHKETKKQGMKAFINALNKADIPEIDAKNAVKKMLNVANVTKNGTLRKGELLTLLEGQFTKEQVRKELGDRICHIGLKLKINTLYEKGGGFKMIKPSEKRQKEYYQQSVEYVRSARKETSTWTQDESSQWSEAESSDQGSS